MYAILFNPEPADTLVMPRLETDPRLAQPRTLLAAAVYGQR